jgi:hypothetical protein
MRMIAISTRSRRGPKTAPRSIGSFTPAIAGGAMPGKAPRRRTRLRDVMWMVANAKPSGEKHQIRHEGRAQRRVLRVATLGMRPCRPYLVAFNRWGRFGRAHRSSGRARLRGFCPYAFLTGVSKMRSPSRVSRRGCGRGFKVRGDRPSPAEGKGSSASNSHAGNPYLRSTQLIRTTKT